MTVNDEQNKAVEECQFKKRQKTGGEKANPIRLYSVPPLLTPVLDLILSQS